MDISTTCRTAKQEEIYDPLWKGRYEEKLAILSSVARVISRHSLQIITSSVYMDDYRYFDSRFKISEALGHPYTLATRLCYALMKRWAARNCIHTPLKMIIEERDEIGDVVEMFRICGDPVPAPEGKGLPQLQAADYVAWMRLKKYQPSSPFIKVRESWKQINKVLYDDQPYMFNHLFQTVLNSLDNENSNSYLPRRYEQTGITFHGNYNNPRRPFPRTARPRGQSI